MKKGFGIVRLLAGLIAAGMNYDRQEAKGYEIALMQRHKGLLLTNGGAAPIPSRFKNQRQKRKLIRQTS